MECLFGLVGKDFALLVADTSAVQSIILQKTEEDKILVLDSHKLVGTSGQGGDRVQFSEYVQKNIALYAFRNGISLSTAAAANYMRSELAKALRSQGSYQTNLLIAGYDEEEGGPSLYYLDYISCLHKMEKAALGYGGYFMLSLMDKYYKKDMSLDEALALVDMCIAEVRSRLVVSPPNFLIKIVDKQGARELVWRRTVGGPAATEEQTSAVPESSGPQPIETQA
eukprot:TRINITY_DN35449_c0_g1_i1.p1 TRINITY_DN35449_c0_g1~~TRINITY_DN35449_c0_g1_i1.p1  ORF type:complete len:225 (+),score=64.18 TRINITY_DN35449_c0_g1_i1:277-951(+)